MIAASKKGKLAASLAKKKFALHSEELILCGKLSVFSLLSLQIIISSIVGYAVFFGSIKGTSIKGTNMLEKYSKQFFLNSLIRLFQKRLYLVLGVLNQTLDLDSHVL